MINNCNQENDVYTGTLAADKAVTDLSEEQLRDVLEQLTDHNLPDSEKCPLVRRLNAENASKDESDLVISRFCKSSTTSSIHSSSNCRTRKSRNFQRVVSKDAEFAREKTNGTNIKAVHSSQSLQDLMSSANSDTDSQIMRAIGANRSGKRLNKANRANSFTMPSGSQHFCNDNYINKEPFDGVVSSTESRNVSHSQAKTRNKNVKARPNPHSSNAPVTDNCIRSGEESVPSDAPVSSRPNSECLTTRAHPDNHNMNSCDNYPSLCNSGSTEQGCEIEMKDLGRRVNIIEYSSQMRNSVDAFADFGLVPKMHKTVGNGDAEAKDFMNSMPEESRLTQFQDLSNFPQNPHLANKDTPKNVSLGQKKKKKVDQQVKLSEEIEGHIGYKDVDYLESFVNSNDTSKQVDNSVKNGTSLISNSSIKENGKKKEKNSQVVVNNVQKRKTGSNASSNQSASAHKNSVSPNIPLSTSSSSFSSDEVNSVSKNSEFAQRTDSQPHETTSPLNSSSDSKQKQLSREDSDNLDDDNVHTTFNSSFSLIASNMSADLLYTASDSEMADREKGFVTPKSKHLKRRRGLMRRLDNQNSQKSWSVQSSTSTTPSSSTVSGTTGHHFDRFSTGMRGYESEREYTEDYRRKQTNTSLNRRKSLSSVPHSEQNSAYNSDGELSSHSMPMRNDSVTTEKSNSDSRTTPSSVSSTPKASYADIAKHYPTSKRTSVDAIYTSNSTMSSLPVQYQDFPQLDLSLPPVSDVLTPSPDSKMIEALVSPSPKSGAEKRELTNDSYSAPTSMTNTPIPQTVSQNECLYSETAQNSNTDRKTDSISDESESPSVPAVIMCDYSESVPFTGSVTFGFFDDLSASSEQNTNKTETHNQNNNDSPDLKEKKTAKSIKTRAEPKSQVNTNGPKLSGVQLKYIDGDKKSFNYEHIITFIRKAWENAKCDHQYVSFESSPKVN